LGGIHADIMYPQIHDPQIHGIHGIHGIPWIRAADGTDGADGKACGTRAGGVRQVRRAGRAAARSQSERPAGNEAMVCLSSGSFTAGHSLLQRGFAAPRPHICVICGHRNPVNPVNLWIKRPESPIDRWWYATSPNRYEIRHSGIRCGWGLLRGQARAERAGRHVYCARRASEYHSEPRPGSAQSSAW
jgi:hypothetical protein